MQPIRKLATDLRHFLTFTCTEENLWAEKYEKEVKMPTDETDG